MTEAAISAEELTAQTRLDRGSAIIIRGKSRFRGPRRRRRAG
jgi:hypothetical protein